MFSSSPTDRTLRHRLFAPVATLLLLTLGTSCPTFADNGSYTPFTFTITSGQNPAQVGDTVSFTTVVGAQYAGGTVTFFDNNVVLGTTQVANDGLATFRTSFLRIGNHPISATLSMGQYTPGTSPFFSQTVNPAPVNQYGYSQQCSGNPQYVYLSLNKTQANQGEPVSMSAYISCVLYAGSMTFYDNNQILASKLIGGQGSAGYTTTYLSVGSHVITAIYTGDASHPAITSQAITVQILPYSGYNNGQNSGFNSGYYNGQNSGYTTTPYYPQQVPVISSTSQAYGVDVSLTSNMNPSFVGSPVTFTAQVGREFEGGNVTFYDNGVSFASAAVMTNGTARIFVSEFTAGSHRITATYRGNGQGTSNAIQQFVSVRSTSTVGTTVQLPVTGAEQDFFTPLGGNEFLTPYQN